MIPYRVLLVALLLPAPALAADAPPADAPPADPAGTVYRLSPADIEAAMARGGTVEPAIGDLEVSGENRIHGTVGAMIGTGGARGVFGAADIPLGENAGASVMFESSRLPGRRWR